MIALTDEYREELPFELEMAETALRQIRRRPDLYTLDEKMAWAGRVYTLRERQAALEPLLDIFTYDEHELQRADVAAGGEGKVNPEVVRELEGSEEYARNLTALNGGGFDGFDGSLPQVSAENMPWHEPHELPRELQPVPTMPEAMIPEPLRRWLTDIAERMQCPLDFPTIGAVVALAGVVGRRVGIRPKQQDDWLVIPNLWGVVIGRPGILKSPALAEAMRPLRRLETEAQKAHQTALEHWEGRKLIAKARREEVEKQIRAAVKNSQGQEITNIAVPRFNDEEPIPTRYIVNDSTVEKLGELLNHNPQGLLLFRDELTGWLRTLDREGHENDRAFYLEAWNGNGSYTYDRVGRGTLHIKAACVSILGGIQPGPLADYLRAAVRGGAGDDGLMQRFQLAVYPDDPGQWQNIDRWPDTEAKNRAFLLFQRLASLDPLTLGAKVAEGEEVPFLRFASDAQGLFNEWRTDLEQKVRMQDEYPVLEAHLSKYRSLMPSLALLFHLLEVIDGKAEGAVSKRVTQVAAAWCDFLEAHVQRIYQGVTQYALVAARQLADRIKAGRLPTPFTPRNVYHNSWMGLSTPEDVERATEVLEDLYWLRAEKIAASQHGGRPRLHYHINPRLRAGKGNAA
jgi:putative DNA primase/helicase